MKKTAGFTMTLSAALFFFVFALSPTYSAPASGKERSDEEVISPEILKGLLGEEVSRNPSDFPVKHYELLKKSENKRPIAYLFLSKDMNLSAKGFKGNIDIAVICDTTGSVLSVIVVNNKDTPKYYNKFERGSLLGDWKGKKFPDKEPDTVSGATFTSKAVNAGVKNILKKLDDNKFFSKNSRK